MKVLLDSHLFIWLLYEPDRVSGSVRSAIQAAESVLLSVATLWELALKHSKGKLAYAPEELAEGRVALNLAELPVTGGHVLALPKVSLVHADPFDRLLVAQAVAEQAVFVTADANILASSHVTLSAR